MTKPRNEELSIGKFDSTIYSIIGFYNLYNACFNKVYECLDKIDKNGGKDDGAAETKKIINYLSQFHSDVYSVNGVIKDFGSNEDFENIRSKLQKHDYTDNDLHENLAHIQRVINDALTHDLNWEGQECCIDIISEALKIISNQHAQDLTELAWQKVVRTICELVFDCALAICALQPLTEWNFGTKNYSLLSSERQLVLLLNKAIVIDRMSLSVHSLGEILTRVNKLADSFLVLNWRVYYAIGFLNFKIHKYDDATKYFKKVCGQNDISGQKEWFHSHLLIAYSYEYSGQFIKAIEQLALSPEKINSFLEKVNCQGIDAHVEEILGDIIQGAISDDDTNLIKLNFSNEFIRNQKISFAQDITTKKKQIEILHALAHCMNEYAIRKEQRKSGQTITGESESINYAKFIFLARATMKFIADQEPEYWTCYATIHGEYADYNRAITFLDDSERQITQETLSAERLFFRYYFKQMLGEEDDIDRKNFEAYCSKYSDNDAQCHVKIFEFRTELRKYFSAFFDKIGDSDFDSEISKKIPEIPEKLKKLHENLCALNPTLYMNVNVRVELRKMQRAYRCLEALIEYIKDENEFRYSVLINACSRFCRTRNEFHIDANEPKIEPTNIKEVFFAKRGSISYCLHNSDSIFLLAPISGVVVYQYQTGTIDTLFDVVSICDESFRCVVDWNSLINEYTEDCKHSERPIIKGIDWSSMPHDLDSVFCWRENDPSNIIVVQKNNSCYIRKIVDLESFDKSIKRFIEKGQPTNRNCKQRDVNIGYPCSVSSVKVEWLEVINNNAENINKTLRIFHYQQNGELQCFIVLSEVDFDCHKFHKGVMRAFWCYEDNGGSKDIEIALKPEDETSQLAKQYLKELLINIKMAIKVARAYKDQGTLTEYQKLLDRYEEFDQDRLNDEAVKTIVDAYPQIKEQFIRDIPYTPWQEWRE